MDKTRFLGYNSSDYHFNRTSRDAFGYNLSAADFEDPKQDVGIAARVAAVIVIGIIVAFWLT